MKRVDALAHKIALSTVKSDIESFCVPVSVVSVSGALYGTWYNPGLVEGYEAEMVRNAIEYAELKGVLQRHPDVPHLVRIKVLA